MIKLYGQLYSRITTKAQMFRTHTTPRGHIQYKFAHISHLLAHFAVLFYFNVIVITLCF